MAEVVKATRDSDNQDHSSALLTFLLADIRGYTRYSAEQGDRAAASLLERFLSLCRDVVSRLQHSWDAWTTGSPSSPAAHEIDRAGNRHFGTPLIGVTLSSQSRNKRSLPDSRCLQAGGCLRQQRQCVLWTPKSTCWRDDLTG